MSRILVVEDDKFFREAIKDLLSRKRHEVFEAPDGKVAREVLSVQDFDMVLTDVQMPGLSGVELLEWAKANKPVPFIMMTGFSMLLETQSAFDLGAKEFLAKPFKNSDLLEAIERLSGGKKEAPVEHEKDQAYCKVSIDEFVARPKTDFDVYVRLSDQKYVKIANKGEGVSPDRLEHYKLKGLRHLYIAKEDFGKLVDFNLDVAKLIQGRSEISREKKLNFMKYTGEVILEKAFVNGVDRQSFTEAESFLNLTVNTISDSEEQLNMLDLLNSHSDQIYAHSIGVSMYALMMARRMGFESNSVFFKLSMAAIFHDIGKKEIDREILEKPRHLLSSTERKLVESHVIRGQEILMAIRGIPEDVVQIVLEHHEDGLGQGYPYAKVKKDMHPLSRILFAANQFMNHALKSAHHQGMPGPQAIQYLERVYGDRIDKECLQALRSLFKNADQGKPAA